MGQRMTSGERAIWAAVYADALDVQAVDAIMADGDVRGTAVRAMVEAAAVAGRAVLALRQLPDRVRQLEDRLQPGTYDLLQQMRGEQD